MLRLLGSLLLITATHVIASKENTAPLWGTYRPNLYFGTRPRLPNSLLTGFMWFGLDDIQNFDQIRHSCELGDRLSQYGYTRHNGRDFGQQTLRDKDHQVEIYNEFIQIPGQGWAARFTGKTLEKSQQGVSLMYYFGLEGNGTMSAKLRNGTMYMKGETPELGKFTVRIVPSKDNRSPPVPDAVQKMRGFGKAKRLSAIGLKVPGAEVWMAKDWIREELLGSARKRAMRLAQNGLYQHASEMEGNLLFELKNTQKLKDPENNLFFAQMVVKGEFAFDVIYESSENDVQIDSETISAVANNRRWEFDDRFESIFGLQGRKKFDREHVEMAQSALSSLVGGIGYFYGSGLVSQDKQGAVGETSPYELLAVAPSRPFFPRGFLWDEGFHQLLLGEWDVDLSMEIVESWLATMDERGWIAREQILGMEARSKVPQEFQVQYPDYANPPTLLFAIERYIRKYGKSQCMKPDMLVDQQMLVDEDSCLGNNSTGRLKMLAGYTKRWLEFFQSTQSGGEDTGVQGYRWRGRTANHTLPSGLDDYPRARPPSRYELHVDLYVWVAYLVRVNSETEGEDDGEYQKYLRQLDQIHWNEKEKMYCDVVMQVRDDYDELEEDGEDGDGDGGKWEKKYVCHKGYISILPMALGLLPTDSDKLGAILDMIEDRQELWTDFGLRSLSLQDEFYGQGENYWRGPIWININYLVLSSLYRNYMNEGPHREKVERIYGGLRDNLIKNVFEEYRRTGFFWEQYGGETGEGKGTHPFTGWTTLIVLAMAEKY